MGHVQGGNDNCHSYEVSKKQLQELLDTVQEVLAHPEKAAEVLPTQEGFFFGNTAYDKDYLDDLEHTKAELERVLSIPADGNSWFKYRSSW